MKTADETQSEPQRYRIAVRELCAFAAREGDLDLRFTPSPTAQQGVQGHQRIVRRRGKGYESEISLSGSVGNLDIRGRADGYDSVRNCLEEIKTHRGDLSRQPAHHRTLHWAQARIYGALMCRARELDGITLALVYLDIGADTGAGIPTDTGAHETTADTTVAGEVISNPKRRGTSDEQRLEAWWSSEALEAELKRLAACFSEFAAQELVHRQSRNTALKTLSFPWPEWRPGQRQLAEGAYKAVITGRELLAEAPTGTGKTLATLFPTLRALPANDTDRIFYLTARTPGRALALEALDTLLVSNQPSLDTSLPLRILELGARHKTCENPTLTCHGDSCPLAQGFYDRLPAARIAALTAKRPLTLAETRRHALSHQICPYFLAQELSRWCDIIIGDHNHYFDSHALLFALTQANDWKVALLVDESHNLIERARSMYSGELDAFHFHSLLKTLSRTGYPSVLRSATRALAKQWRALPEQISSHATTPPADGLYSLTALPTDFFKALSQWSAAIGDWLADPEKPEATERKALNAQGHTKHPETAPEQLGLIAAVEPPTATETIDATGNGLVDAELMEAYFSALSLTRLAEGFGSHSLFEITLVSPSTTRMGAGRASLTASKARSIHHIQPRLRCVSPAPWLAPRLRTSHASVLFSATLNPPAFHHRLLGLADNAVWLSVDSPFAAHQVKVSRHRISTRLRDRDASCQPIAHLMATQYHERPGNYLAFFSSFAYLDQVAAALSLHDASIPQWHQIRGMEETARRDFVQRFTLEGRGIGFAVLGGAFGEGIDLPGSRLIGAFIATLGLAGFGPENEALKQRLGEWLKADALERSRERSLDHSPGDTGGTSASSVSANMHLVQPLNADDCTYLYPGLTRVVQAAGRVIRSEQDEGVIHLIDDRFLRPEVARLLPRWWMEPV